MKTVEEIKARRIEIRQEVKNAITQTEREGLLKEMETLDWVLGHCS